MVDAFILDFRRSILGLAGISEVEDLDLPAYKKGFMEMKPWPTDAGYRITSEGRAFGKYGKELAKTKSGTGALRWNMLVRKDISLPPEKINKKAAEAVLEAFIGPARGRPILHINGNSHDDRIVNLAYLESGGHATIYLGNGVIFNSRYECEAECEAAEGQVEGRVGPEEAESDS